MDRSTKVRCPLCHVDAEYLGIRSEYACPKCNSWMAFWREEGLIEMNFYEESLEPLKRPSEKLLRAGLEYERRKAEYEAGLRF